MQPFFRDYLDLVIGMNPITFLLMAVLYLVALAVWAVIGFLVWISAIVRTGGVVILGMIARATGRDDPDASSVKVFAEAVQLYGRGFHLVHDSIWNSDRLPATTRSNIGWGTVLYELFSVGLVWGLIAFAVSGFYPTEINRGLGFIAVQTGAPFPIGAAPDSVAGLVMEPFFSLRTVQSREDICMPAGRSYIVKDRVTLDAVDTAGKSSAIVASIGWLRDTREFGILTIYNGHDSVRIVRIFALDPQAIYITPKGDHCVRRVIMPVRPQATAVLTQ